jgi:hypothetical protein
MDSNNIQGETYHLIQHCYMCCVLSQRHYQIGIRYQQYRLIYHWDQCEGKLSLTDQFDQRDPMNTMNDLVYVL